MPKHKKTREQKILAETRRETPSNHLYTLPQESLKSQAKPINSQTRPTIAIATNAYKYLTADLRKTGIATAIIILLEIVIHYFTKGV